MSVLYSFYTEIVIFYAIVFLFCLGLGLRSFWNHKGFSSFIFNQLTFVLLAILCALCISEGHWHFVLQSQIPEHSFYPTVFLSSTMLSFTAKVVLLLLTISCVFLHKPTVALRSKVAVEYSILILLITLASFLLISATNLAFAFVAMELQTLSLIAFAFLGHQRKTIPAEATFRYFVNAAFASVSFLFAISLLYALTGTLQLEQLVHLLESSALTTIPSFRVILFISFTLLLFSFFFKLTLAPFHHWVGDLYQGTSGYVGSYFTLVTKLPMWVLLTKVFLLFLTPSFAGFLWSLQWVAVFSLFIGNVYAFSESNFRRFWALGSVGHMGQILLALSLFGAESVLVASFYLFLYLSANIFFWGLLLHQDARPSLDLSFWEFFRSIFRFFSMYNQRLAILLLFVIASLAGVPPAFGFAAKFYLFLVLYQAQSFTLLACVFFINLISLSYYLRLIRFIFFNHSSSAVSFQDKQLAPWSRSMLWAFALIFLLHCFFGFWLLQILIYALLALF